MALRLIIETVRSFFETVFLAWGVPLYKNFFYGTYKDILLSLAPTLLAVASIILYYVLFKPAKPINGAVRDQKNFSRDWIWIGIFAVIFGLIPLNFIEPGCVFRREVSIDTLCQPRSELGS